MEHVSAMEDHHTEGLSCICKGFRTEGEFSASERLGTGSPSLEWISQQEAAFEEASLQKHLEG